MPDVCRKSGEECYGKRELNLLFEISSLLNKTNKDLTVVFKPVIELLAKYLNADRVLLSILNRTSLKIHTEVAYGLTQEERSKAIYEIGEGITGKGIETGMPVVIPRISENEFFLNRTGSISGFNADETSFICVPIKEENENIGTLSMMRRYNKHITFSEDANLLSIAGSLIAQSVRNRQEYI